MEFFGILKSQLEFGIQISGVLELFLQLLVLGAIQKLHSREGWVGQETFHEFDRG